MSILGTVDESTPLQNDGYWPSGSGVIDHSQLENGTSSKKPTQIHERSIGILGSIAIMVNSLTGPAMLNLPSTFQKAGLVPTTITLMLLCFLSSLCSSHTANVISKIPRNSNYQKEIEYSEVFRHMWGKKAFIFTQIAFFCCITCLNIASIVDTSQVVDNLISRSTQRGTFAMKYDVNATSSAHRLDHVWWSHRRCEKALEGDSCIPFQENQSESVYLLSAGYVVSCLLFLPMSLRDLKENAIFQIIGFLVLIILSLQFIASFLLHGVSLSNATLWGYDWGDMFGVILFNFAVVIVIPAWLYEKKTTVGVNFAIYSSSSIGFLLYVFVGGLGALTIPNVSENMLQTMIAGGFGRTTEICAELFVFFIIGLGIPLFSVLLRLNLTGSGLFSEMHANLLSVYLPWGISWVFYSNGRTSGLLGWGGIFFSSIIVFLAPLLLAIHTVRHLDEEGSVAVYGENLFRSKQKQLMALYVLLFVSIISIILAFVGELY